MSQSLLKSGLFCQNDTEDYIDFVSRVAIPSQIRSFLSKKNTVVLERDCNGGRNPFSNQVFSVYYLPCLNKKLQNSRNPFSNQVFSVSK